MPVALTLQSGGAAAASLTSLARQVAAPRMPPENDTTEMWLRVPIWSLAPAGNDNNSLWISGADIYALAKRPTTSFIQQDEWFCLSAETKAKMNSVTKTDGIDLQSLQRYTPAFGKPSSGAGGAMATAVADRSRLVAVRVNAQGDIIGVVGDGGTTGSAVTQSIWASFTI